MKFKYAKYHLLSHITFGNMRKHYKKKWQEAKLKIKQEIDQTNIINQLHNIAINVEINKKILINSNLDYIKNEMVKRKLFDEEFYEKNYPDYKKYGLSAIDHYIKIGWKLLYNPSKAFDTSLYLETNKNLNYCPVVHFLCWGHLCASYGYCSNPFKSPCIKKRKGNKKVVYTCIVGNYDELLQQTYLDEEWDYICFTDNVDMLNASQIGHWEIRPLHSSDMDNVRINRFHKINAHLILSEYEESLYIDANVNILSPFIFDLIKTRNVDLLLPRHFSSICAYNHSEWILQNNFDPVEKVKAFLRIMRSNNFPCNYGMTENNIIYRRHNIDLNIKIMEEWWSYVRDYCKRDQLSLSYVLWKNNISIYDISYPNARSDIDNFMLVMHDKRR